MYKPEGPHPNPQWLKFMLENVFDSKLLQELLDEILNNLHYYLDNTDYVLDASAILDYCFAFAMERSRYDRLKDLHVITLDTFEDNGYQTQYANEYFRLTLNLGHIALMIRETNLAMDKITKIIALMDDTNLINQLDACCVILKFASYGYQLKSDIDFVTKTLQLAYKYNSPDKLKDAYVAIAYYHYSQGKLKETEEALRKIKKVMIRRGSMPDMNMVTKITAEQHYYLSVIYREQENFKQARRHLNQASEHYASIDNWERNMLILHENALWYTLRDEDNPDPDDLQCAQQWLDLARQEYYRLQNPHKYHYGMLEHTQGLIYFHQKEYELALEKFHSIIDIWEEHKHQYHMALTYNVIGYTHYVMEKYEEAIKYYEEAEEICEPLPEEHSKRLLKTIQEHLENARNFLE